MGIIGLQEALESTASKCEGKPENEITQVLLDVISKRNYIPGSAKDNYGKAFLREFRKFVGQPQDDPEDGQLRIKVLGPGCYQCDQLERTIMELLNEMNVPASVEHVTDLEEIARMGIMRLPALVINGKIVSTGTFLTAKRIKELILDAPSAKSKR